MNPIIFQLVIAALQVLVPEIGRLLIAFLENLHTTGGSKAPDLAGEVSAIIEAITTAHPEWSNDQKRRYAIDAVKQYAIDEGLTVGEALINTLVELAVQRLKADMPAPAPTGTPS